MIEDEENTTIGTVVLEVICNNATETSNSGSWTTSFEQKSGEYQSVQVFPNLSLGDDPVNASLEIWYKGNKLASFDGEIGYLGEHTICCLRII